MKVLLDWLQVPSLWSAITSFFIMSALAFIPAVPIPLLASIIASSYPFIIALIISLGGTLFGSICMYYVARYVLQKYALRKITQWKSIHGFFDLLERNGFLAILIGRLIPIMPSAAINTIAGVSKIKFFSFFFATLIGKFPTMLAFTLAGAQFEEQKLITTLFVLLYLFVLIMIAFKLKHKWSKN
ncbi:VTT domain-containing protein [Lysinibacillus sp. M3]|uniref:TVP38/TMEM64 family membrane protein n=1 Tax=Lysinibacillus zambalensis TaxID=3160866 RepID=A0ABV1ML11_9BACI